MPFDIEAPMKRRWFERWWGIILIVVGFLFSALLLTIAGFTARYWWQIAHGATPGVALEWRGQFTDALPHASAPIGAVQLDNSKSPMLGRPGAPVEIVEFIDFKCPNCRIAAPVMKQVLSSYGTNVTYITRHFPVETLHPGATTVSELAECAHAQNRYWPLHDWLFANQEALPETLSDEAVYTIATAVDLEYSPLKLCLENPATAEKVRRDYLEGVRNGVVGTPTFFVNGQKVEGAIPFTVWQKYLLTFLNK
jgi:protein-disulfide isomerase